MPTSILGPYTRTIIVGAVIATTLIFAFTNARVEVWFDIQPLFEWMETTWFGVIGKTWGAAFAFVEAIHLLGLAMLGGSVLVGEGRVLGLIFTDIPARTIIDRTHRVFVWALITLLATGIFMACGVAMKIYYLPVYWYKMLALAAGILFHFFIRKPLLVRDLEAINPWLLKAVAISSVMVWFTVAATGRWIGFSG
ncbi:MAG: hypothetical protein O2971_01960 [Proteobacteria bacterium]|nr:hypothetical protein [Pseudomonadota bacterium]